MFRIGTTELLIVLGILIAVTAWLGLNKVDEGFNGWTHAALGLITLTLVVASFKVAAVEDGLSVGITGKLIAEIALIAAVWFRSGRGPGPLRRPRGPTRSSAGERND